MIAISAELREKARSVLAMIEADVAADIERFEGAYFNGRNVATLLGKQAAAIAALATILRTILEEEVPS